MENLSFYRDSLGSDFLNIAICDDEVQYIEQIQKAVADFFESKHMEPNFYTYTDSCELLKENIKFDLAFLDIEMPHISGIQVGKKLKENYPNTVIFMVTAHSDYLDDAMDFGAFRFLSKPLNLTRLYRSLDSALQHMATQEIHLICSNKESVCISTNDIIYCEAYERKTKIVTTEGTFISQDKLSFWKNKLDAVNFYSPHASYILNFRFVKSFTRKTATMLLPNGEELISIAPKKQQEFKKRMFLYAERGI